MRESHVEQTVNAFARNQGWYAWKFASPAQRGAPDMIYFRDGECLMIEFKAPGGKPTPYQHAIHKRFKEHGFHVYVIDNIDQGKLLFAV